MDTWTIMEAIPTIYSQVPVPTPKSPNSSKSLPEDEALSKLVAKNSVLGEVMKVLFERLDETNKKLDDIQEQLRRHLDTCQNQITEWVDAELKVPEEHRATKLETISTVQAEQKDSGGEVAGDCLRFPTILRRILEHFSDKELIDLSLVSKLWNFEARSVIRDRGCLKAAISPYPSVCQSLVDFASDLGQMRVVPFTGIAIEIGHPEYKPGSCQSAALVSLGPLYQVILDRLTWKNLSVKFLYRWEAFKDCPALVLVEKILEDYCGVLEDFSVFNRDSESRSESTEFLQSLIQGRGFPCLKILEVTGFLGGAPLLSAMAKAFVSSAPNLDRLYWRPIIFQENVLEGSSAKLMVPSFSPLYEQVCESLIDVLRVEQIRVQPTKVFEVERLNRFVPMVVEASRTTLKALVVDWLFTLPLMCYGICLENVTELALNMTTASTETTDAHILEIVKAFDFTRVFPKLSQVYIWESRGELQPDEIGSFVERGNAMLRNALPDRAINIKHLALDEVFFGNSTIPFLTQIFPHVETIAVEGFDWREFSFTPLLEHFGSLEALHVHYQQSSTAINNLDSVFCGIFPEEVTELRTQDDDYLKAVNIVPVMPSITCMRGEQRL